jgi:hypothetical protein
MLEDKVLGYEVEEVVEKTSETVEDTNTINPAEEKVEPSKREEIEDMLKEQDAPVDTEDEEVEEDLSEESDEVTEDSETEESESTNPVEEMINEHKKDGKQKRIDKLTAINSDLTGELATIKQQIQELTSAKNKETTEVSYTDEQLETALEKAIETGDSGLQFEVMKEMQKQAEKKAYDRIKGDERKLQEEQKALQTEVNKVRTNYSYLSDTDTPELYEGSHEDMDVNNPKSLIAQTATYLYNMQSAEAKTRYTGVQGISIAVNDALKIILNHKKGLRPKDKEKESLKRKVKKAGKKTSVSGSKSVKTDTKTPKQKTSDESFQDEIAHRKSMSRGIKQ